MARRWIAGLVTTALLLSATPMPAHAAASDADLAYRWAPIHYQDSASSKYIADYLASVDYDGDWNTRNNWDNLDANAARLVGTVYYSVVETGTHWFIIYGYFHARDWKLLGSHENDMEGLLLTVYKDGSAYGTLQAMVTLSHDNFYSYTPAGSPFTNGRENIDATLITQPWDGEQHPTSFQETKGHGCKAWNGGSFPGGDGIVYFPSRGGGEVPSGGNDRSVAYQLVDIFGPGGLWERRNDPQPYASWGTFAGDNGTDNAAHAPWAWDDFNDGSDLQPGVIATDPAYLTAMYFGNLGTFSLDYTRNTYRQ
ncbi:hypothetical protein GCM10009555_002680 [Acrocarpospora macrocephala]|uniref:Neprosin domain-containing protein n=1 Tax=Acrocarpospora macrocephala TaxID=150177 RepID=A0A5M3WZ88_9ACTN|nr:hypothetical protein [Acrocarpospora macrocephala]GES11743.1 hypothetical protein Amac_053400 [Acrocarpospora macrocephala]